MTYWWEVLLSHPQNQKGLLGCLLEGNWQEYLLCVEMEEYLLHALTPQVEGRSLFLLAFTEFCTFFSKLSPRPGVSSEVSLGGVEVGPSAPEGLGGECFSWGFSGRSLSVRGRVPTESWE